LESGHVERLIAEVMVRKRRLSIFLVSTTIHFGLSLYWLSGAIGCGASNTCDDWINWADFIVGFPVFDFLRLFEHDGSRSSGETLLALLIANSVLIGLTVTVTAFLVSSRRGPESPSIP